VFLIFAFWVAFSSLLVLCLLQRWVRRLPLLFPQVVDHHAASRGRTLHWCTWVPNGTLKSRPARIRLQRDRRRRPAQPDRNALLLFRSLPGSRRRAHVAQAREQALRARVRPHFLFNSMNTIAGLCRTDPARAEQVTLDLADLFRATFATGATHSLAEELELVRAYLDIEQTRFGERLALGMGPRAVSTNCDLQVPTFMLQPLVENAIQHGIAPVRASGGQVSIPA
jgi:two-component system, LytTR family, sensor histidine kinase AlgZ